MSTYETSTKLLRWILEILPQLPGSQVDEDSVRRALTQLDKNRLNNEIASGQSGPTSN